MYTKSDFHPQRLAKFLRTEYVKWIMVQGRVLFGTIHGSVKWHFGLRSKEY